MCDCVQPSIIMAYGSAKSGILGVTGSNYSKPLSKTTIGARDCSVSNRNGIDVKCVAGNIRAIVKRERPLMNQRVCASFGLFDSYGLDLSSGMPLSEEESEKFELGFQSGEGELRYFRRDDETDDMIHKSLKRGRQSSNFDDVVGKELEGSSKGENLIGTGNGKKEDTLLQPKEKQLIKRSSILAKQVIGIQSALSLGFVSQIWVDPISWLVLEVEARQNFLSSEAGKFLLKDIKQVGDVVLVRDESVMLNEFRTNGLETLVGYSVVTPGQRNLGKVRSYSFNINSGTVEFLELDAFGYSLIPSSLVTTYALFTEDVLEVSSDTIVVHEAAASRIQRLTKGVLGTGNIETSSIHLNYDDPVEEDSIRPVKGRKTRRKSRQRKFYPRRRDFNNDLELPMDYM